MNIKKLAVRMDQTVNKLQKTGLQADEVVFNLLARVVAVYLI